MIKFHQTVGKIGKGGKAQYGKYANLKDILEVVNPALTQNGLVLTQIFEPPVEPSLPPVLVTRLIHVSGDFIESKLPMIIPKGRGNAMHDFGGAITYLKRYALLPILGLEADMEEHPERLDDDGDRFSSEPAAKPALKPASKTAAKIDGIPVSDLPLSVTKRNQMLHEVKDQLSEEQLQKFCQSFRRSFDLPDNASLNDTFTAEKHAKWLYDNVDFFGLKLKGFTIAS